VREAGAHVGREQSPIEAKGTIELSKTRVRFAVEPSTSKIPVELVTHY